MSIAGDEVRLFRPTFILIGAPKGGTTSLYHYLRQHPQIAMGAMKDGHYFLFDGEAPPMTGPMERYRAREYVKRLSDYQAQFGDHAGILAFGEVAVRYLDSPAACERIYRRLPEVRLIVILRDPVERAWSHFRMYRRDGLEPCSTLAEALADESRRRHEGWFWGVYRHLGYYHHHLRPWCECFGADQIRVYLYDDLKADPALLMRDLFSFVKVDPDFTPDLTRQFNTAGQIANPVIRTLWFGSQGLRSYLSPWLPVRWRGHVWRFVASRKVIPEPREALDPMVATDLRRGYHDDILALQNLIGRDLSHWLDGLATGAAKTTPASTTQVSL